MNRLLKYSTYALVSLSLLGLIGCQSQPTDETAEVEPVEDGGPDSIIIKPPSDERSYRYLTLDNGLNAILIHQPVPGKAGAALAVARGSNHDLPEVPGIAHYLEHMLFLGTEKYPDPDGYSDFISKHGGTMNAFTANELTNYFFDIGEEHFPEALDRFAQFFSAPLLDETYVEREKNAVHSEYQMQMKTDGWRGFSVLKTIMNPNHPMSRFNIGSLDTLKDADRDLVLQYYQDNYSADQMTLTVLSHRPLDEIETLVRERFDPVPNRNHGDAPLPPPLYEPESLPLAIGYQTVMSNRSMTMEWPVPDIKPHYKSKPLSFISFLVGHEGKGSLHELLQDRGWINSLGASGNRDDTANSSFNLSIGLTEAGWEHVSEIRALVFEYLDMLRSTELEEWRYQEQATMRDLDFRFMSHGSTPATVNRFTQAAFEYEPQDLLRGGYLMNEFDLPLIENYLSYLTRENVITAISAPDVETDQTEKWFSVPYTLNPDIDLDYTVDHTFELPARNLFIPENTELTPDATNQPPSLIVSEGGIEVWQTTDTTFNVPRATLQLQLRPEEYVVSESDVVHGRLLAQLLNIQFNTDSYPALMAGLGGSFSSNSDGLLIEINGYDDKQSLLLLNMIELLKSYEIDQDQLDTQKTELIKDYQNFKDTRPFQQAYSTVGQTLISTTWPPSQLAAAVENVSSESLNQWFKQRYDQVAVRVLLVGNATEDDAREIAETIKQELSLVSVDDRLPDIHRLDGSYTFNLNIEHDDAVYLSLFQGKDATIEERAVIRMIEQIISQAYFNELRTEQQLGYVTIAQAGELVKQPMMVFLVQSPVADTLGLQSATRTFIEKHGTELASMEQEEFDGFRDGLLTALLEEDKNLSQRAGRYANNLRDLVRTFDTREQLAEAIRSLSLEDVRTAYDRILDPSGTNQLEIYSPGKQATILSAGKAISSASAFKSNET